jgi:hypothetical protein
MKELSLYYDVGFSKWDVIYFIFQDYMKLSLILFMFNFDLKLFVLHNFTLKVCIYIQRIPEVKVG